ncbi:DUF1302 domain-containing protein [Pseudidiomarina sp. 1ASP75-14]|uniref:DUF1302 domain-containing protein n=1 Tax=Pseudidiomarina terrestris TaxID=2820060 RepID=UPI002651DD1C|nr:MULTISPECIES: DUF1302 domain-containing protein [unclassified Pseudidiomarina]MDN7127028.1 DUF1302 domain-containing protein [Pseudidiomarina sp. 1APR75-33.1]MDN7136870.1 DUF1302 domain-containing protein [Pseudidiomarina sp. 1ASP75-14]
MLKKLPLATAIALAFAGSAGAHAAEFEVGDFRVKFDSIISYGAAWRMEDRDMRLIHPGNMDGGMGQSGVADDGNLNYDQGDLVSSVVKGVHDLSIDGGDYGAFVRFKYWYDDVIKNNEVPHGHTATNYFPDVTLNNDGLDDYSTGSGFELLDAFVYAYFDLGDMPANLRVGRQVLSWGESTFIFNGVNSINPIDVNAVRRPGVEIKEALLPVGMVNLNLGLTDETSLDMFYQYEWDNTKLDGCGTFFSTVDILGGPGCNKVTLNPTLVPGQPSSSLSDRESVEFGTYLDRSPNIEPDDGGQYGFALRHYNMDLDVEFGVYYMNIHNQTPIISAYNWVEQPSPGLSHPDGLPIAGPNYVLQYPEDQEIMGASFSTNFGLWSVGGEYSFRPDLAVQINTTEILTAGLRAGVPSTFSNRIRRDETGAITNLGELQPGYDELDVSQFQLTGIRFLDNVLGASRLTFIGEVAMNKVHSLPSLDEQRYGRNPVYGKCLTQADQQMLGNPSPAADINCEGFVTASSWGYRTRFVAEYNNVVAGWNLTPTLAFGHDVKGYSPNSNFIEGRKTIGLSVDASYLSSYKIGVGYNINTGGDYEPASDRDFASVSFSYSF